MLNERNSAFVLYAYQGFGDGLQSTFTSVGGDGSGQGAGFDLTEELARCGMLKGVTCDDDVD